MIISTLFAALGLLTGGQVVHDIPLQEIQQTADFTRYKFEHYENRHIVDLNRDNEIVAYYINNNLQNELFVHTDEYDEYSKNDLMHQFFLNDANILNYPDEHINTGTQTLTGRNTDRGEVYERSRNRRDNPPALTPMSHREYNSINSEYYSRDGRCYQRGGRRKRNGFLGHKGTSFVRNGIITELDPASSHCPDNRTIVLNYRENPLLFFRPSAYTDIDSAGRAGNANQNFVIRDFSTVGYLTDEYIDSGWGMEEEDLANLILFYNFYRIHDLLVDSEWAENLTLSIVNSVATKARDIIIQTAVEQIISKVMEEILKKKLSNALVTYLSSFGGFLLTIQEIYSEIRAFIEIPRLTTSSTGDEGGILTRNGPSGRNLNTNVSPRSG